MKTYTNKQLINKIADIREIIPVEMFDECHPSALSASVGCPYECLCYIEEIVKNLIKEKATDKAFAEPIEKTSQDYYDLESIKWLDEN